MFPSKFKALTSDESEDSDADDNMPSVTKEALEQRAVSQYQEVLLLEQSGKWHKSEEILRKLIRSDVLMQVQGRVGGSSQSSMAHLKYCVMMNLGHCLVKLAKLQEGLEYYIEATKLDDTDLNLWYRIGLVAMRIPDLNIAASAFEEGLRCSPNHWPCIDNIITVLYAMGDYVGCLYFVSKGLQMDVGFTKGHIFKDRIFKNSPSLVKDFPLFYPDCPLPDLPNNAKIEDTFITKLYREADELIGKKSKKWDQIPAQAKKSLQPERAVKLKTWVQLSKCLIYLVQLAEEKVDDKLIFAPVCLKYKIDDVDPIEILDNMSEDDTEDESLGKNNQECEEEEQVKGGGKASSLLERWMCSQKRRSARVRSTVRREEPSLARSLAQLIPHNLLPREEKKDGMHMSEDSMSTMDLYRLFENKDSNEEVKPGHNCMTPDERAKVLEGEGYFNTEKETRDVELFVKTSEESRGNIIEIISELVIQLSSKWNLYWPDMLGRYYVRAFQIYLDYNPPTMRCDLGSSSLEEDISVITYGELLLDQWILKGKQKGWLSPLGDTALGGSFSSLFLGQLNRRALDSEDPTLIARIFWLEAHLFFYSNDSESAALSLQKILNDDKCGDVEVKLPNVIHNPKITCSITSDLLRSLRRNKNLAEVLELYNGGYYEDVTDILSDSLKADDSGGDVNDGVISRHMQFALILESYWRLAKYKECLRWSECCLHEALMQYRNCSDEERPQSATLIVNTLQGLLTCVDTVGCIIFDSLASEKRTRFIQTLSSIICHQMEAPDNTPEMPIESVAPWILLHYVIKYDEEKKKKLAGKKLHEIEEDEELPPSLLMLFQGHEYLGRRSWCCFEEGALLFHTLSTVYPAMQVLSLESESLTKINHQVEQIFYCLYGQQKKSKGRHIVDHNVMGLAMTWNRAQQVFIFTRPRELPSYDTSGRCCISTDTEYLYTKLIKLVPDENNPSRLIDEMTKYIEGEISDVPRNNSPLPAEVEDIYYLLAHFYFRSKSWGKALRYYLLDVCANPCRVDSWACLALARGSQIETKLNSCETIKSECDLLNNAGMVCKCYERALQLDPTQSTLWIERGTFSYTIHSFCSNLLKKELNLSLEMFDMLEKQKESMINAAFDCFTNANKLWYSCAGKEIQDERWLHHYMLGKIAEKKEEDPSVYINHYSKASELLHEIGATYPSHISYSAPQPLAVESIELYYRVHACILKAIESEDKVLHKNKIIVFKNVVNKFSRSPFVTQVSDCNRYEKPRKSGVPRKTFSSDEEGGSVCPDVKEMMHDLLIKVEDDCSLKRKLSDTQLTTDSDEPSVKSLKVEEKCFSSSVKTDPRSEVQEDCKLKETNTSGKPAPVEKRNSSSSSNNKKSSDSSSESESSSDTSSSSSSSSSSSDSDSSTSESQQDSDDSDEEPPEKKKRNENIDWAQEQEWLVTKCLSAMELCKKRFPEHYKSLYHLAHFYCKSKPHKNNPKVYDLLLGQGGLFADRHSKNFFNGIWRIPNNEIDRPGSFAAHMGRCVHLLLDFLRETKDHKMLLDLALQLKYVPEPDKKYLRDNEREELCKEAVTLSVQSLRKKLQEVPDEENLKKFLMETYQAYKKVSKSNIKEPLFGNILCETYSKLSISKTDVGLEGAIKYCQQEAALLKQQSAAILVQQSIQSSSALSISPSSNVSLPLPKSSAPTPEVVPALPEVNLGMGSVSSSSGRRGSGRPATGRKPRGRPPLSNSGSRAPRNSNFQDVYPPKFSQFSGGRFSSMAFMSYQTELLRQYSLQNAELQRKLAQAQVPQHSDVQSQGPQHQNKGHQSSTDLMKPVKSPLIKDRPNLSITPVKPAQSATVSHPKVQTSPISVSVQKLSNKSVIGGSVGRGGAPPVPRSAPVVSGGGQKMVTLQPGLTISPRGQEPAQRKPHQSVSIIQKAGPSLPVPPHLPTFPDMPKQPSVIHPPVSQKSLDPLHISPPKQNELSLQHKLLSAKKMASLQSSTPKNKSPGDPERGRVQKSSSSVSDITRNITESKFSGSNAGDMSISKLPPKQSPLLPPGSKLPMQRYQPRPELFESISITPAVSRTDTFRGVRPLSQSRVPSQPVIDNKYKFLNTVPNLDSSVAETIKNFGSSITITPSTIGKISPKPLPNITVQPVKQKEKMDCEVIVLDD